MKFSLNLQYKLRNNPQLTVKRYLMRIPDINPLLRIISIVLSIVLFMGVTASAGQSQDMNMTAENMKEEGSKCYHNNKYSDAMSWFLKGLEKAEKEGDRRIAISCLGNIGTIFAVMNDYGSAIFYFDKALREAEKIHADDLAWIYASNLTIASCKIGEIDKAIEYAEKNTLYTPVEVTPEQQFMLMKNDYYLADARKDRRKAFEMAQRMYGFSDSLDLGPFYKVISMSYMCEVFTNVGETDSAFKYVRCGNALAREAGLNDFLAQGLINLANLYATIGDTLAESRQRQLATNFADSIYERSKFEQAKLDFLNEQDKTQTQNIDNLKRKISWQLIALIAIGAALISTGVFAAVVYRLNRRLKLSYQSIYHYYRDMLDHGYNGLSSAATNVRSSTPKSEEEKNDDGGETLLLQKVMEVMDNPAFVTNPDFSLSLLAREVGSNTKYVSSVINKRLNRNFRSLLNEKRIMEACRMIRDRSDLSMPELAEMAGYKSLSSFYSSFKTIVAMTPAEFRSLDRKEGSKNQSQLIVEQ